MESEVPEWQLPEPYAEVIVSDSDLADWVRGKRRIPIIAPENTGHNFDQPIPRSLLTLSNYLSQIQGHSEIPQAIDLGCGAGRDAWWLHQNGWSVLGVDRLPAQAPIPFLKANLHEFSTAERYDLVLLHYCWDPLYLKLALSLIKPTGIVSVLAHSERNFRCFAHPRQTKTISVGQVRPPGFTILSESEFWSRDRHSLQIVLAHHRLL